MESVLVFVLLAILSDQGNISSSRSVSSSYIPSYSSSFLFLSLPTCSLLFCFTQYFRRTAFSCSSPCTSPLTHLLPLVSPRLILYHPSLFASSAYLLIFFPANLLLSLPNMFLIFVVVSKQFLILLCFCFPVIMCVYLLSVFS